MLSFATSHPVRRVVWLEMAGTEKGPPERAFLVSEIVGPVSRRLAYYPKRCSRYLWIPLKLAASVSAPAWAIRSACCCLR
jgi:hypothetical protein